MAVIGNTLRRLTTARMEPPPAHVVRGYACELRDHLVVLVEQCGSEDQGDEEELEYQLGVGRQLLREFPCPELPGDEAWKRTRRLGEVTERLLACWCRQRSRSRRFFIEAESDGAGYAVVDQTTGSYAHYRTEDGATSVRHLAIARAQQLADRLNFLAETMTAVLVSGGGPRAAGQPPGARALRTRMRTGDGPVRGFDGGSVLCEPLVTDLFESLPAGTYFMSSEFDGVTVTSPSAPRVYDFLLGGKDHYECDRLAAEKVLAVLPHARVVAQQNRSFMHRAAGFLAEQGVTQYLDIGTGIPTSPNLHEVVQAQQPGARVVYVDNNQVVMRHAEALMQSTTEQGYVTCLEADLRDPHAILGVLRSRGDLDFREPIGLSLNAVLHFLPDADDPHGIVRTLIEALPEGSWLTLSHVTPDLAPKDVDAAVTYYRSAGIPAQARTRTEMAQFFTGLAMAEPGITLVHRWRPQQPVPVPAAPAGAAGAGDVLDEWVSCYGAVARKTAGYGS
ncbi:SAM-dependent methyltransferase [Streptomyces sp. MAR4 CNY-716]